MRVESSLDEPFRISNTLMVWEETAAPFSAPAVQDSAAVLALEVDARTLVGIPGAALIGGVSTVKFIVAVAVPETDPLAVMLKLVAVRVTVGVPDI